MGHPGSPEAQERIEDRLLAAIRSAGLDPDEGFSPDELGALDHFHTGGRRATGELLALAALNAEMTVLDIGAGIGGPSRLIASQSGCRVICLEPSEELCRCARMLNRMTHLDERIEVHEGAAPPIPFADSRFDLVLMQNVGMCIADKPGLYREVARVLRPGGRFLFQEVLTGPAGEPHFPLPWAEQPSTSFMLSLKELRRLLNAADLVREVLEDISQAELDRPSAAAAHGPLTLAVYVPDIATKARNSRRSLEEGRIRLTQGACRKR